MQTFLKSKTSLAFFVCNILMMPWKEYLAQLQDYSVAHVWLFSLHKKWSFQLRISLVNVTKSTMVWHTLKIAANAGIIDRFCSLIWISFINALISFINRTKSSLSIFGSIFLSKQWLLLVLFHLGLHLANIHLFKVSNRNVEKDLKLVQRLKKMTSERRHCGCSVVFCWLLLKSPWKVIL